MTIDRPTLKLSIKPKPLTNNLTQDSLTQVPDTTTTEKVLEQKAISQTGSKTFSKEMLKESTKLSNSDVSTTKLPSKKYLLDPKEYKELLKLIQEKYPITFPPYGTSIKIFAIGIDKDLTEQLGISKP